jgi:hypothetical protein
MRISTVSSGMLWGVVFFVAFVIILYYIYEFLYSSGGVQSSINIIPEGVLDKTKIKSGGIVRCDSAVELDNGDSAVAQLVNAQGLSSGGQYSVSMWLSVYSTNPETSGTGTIPLLDITGTSAKTLLFIGLMPTNGTLVVHQGTTDETHDGTVGVFGMTTSPSGSGPYSGTDKCNIVNGIEYQRWILINVVSNGRTLDVYIDGKLSRSCVYTGMNHLGVSTGKGTLTVGRQNATHGPINGVFSTTDYYNYALTPDIIWGIYQTGPSSTTSGNFLSTLFNTNIDLSLGTA